MSANSLINPNRLKYIDRFGNILDGAPGLLRAEPLLASVLKPATYSILNLGYVEYGKADHGIVIRCRPSNLSPETFTQLLYELADADCNRVALSYYDKTWHHHVFKSSDMAFGTLLELIDTSANEASESIFSVDLAKQTEAVDTRLVELLNLWRPRVSWRQFGEFVDRVTEIAEDRHVLFEYDTNAGCFRIRDFGSNVPEWAKMTLSRNRGRAVEEINDSQFGKACATAYHQTLEKFEPRLEAIDANINWPVFGLRRSQFCRATLPMIDPSKRLWLLSATIADNRIDLRTDSG